MVVNIGVGVSFFIVLLIILAVFYSKPRLDIIENKYFKKLIIVTLFGLLIEVVIYNCVMGAIFSKKIYYDILIKILYLYYCLWMYYFVCYGFVIFYQVKDATDSKYRLFKNLITGFYVIAFLCSVLLPITLTINDEYIYPYGIGTTAQYIICALGMNIIGFFALKNIKILKKKEALPFIACTVLGIISTIIQILYHQFLFIVPSHAIAIILMYFTIENPDIKMIEQLNLAKNIAEKANHAKSDFLSSMSHEIRTPLNAIVGLSEDIKDHKGLPKDVEDEAKDIVSASHTLLEIVGNILDINKIESEKMEIIEVPYHFKEEILELAKIASTRIGEKPIDYQIHIAEDVPYELLGDRIHIKQIVNNLLTNAIKYTEQGSIALTVKCINQNNTSLLIITCQDTGRGIKAENIEKLFTKFERLGVEKTSTAEGTGLGLAITKKLVEMMGGTINVQSQYGKGSIFVVQVPQKISKLVNPNPNKNDEDIELLKVDDPYSDKRVLIVDDNQLNIKVAKVALKDFNFMLEECTSGNACLEKIKAGNQYDLILMDIMMPEMSGETTLSELQKIEGFHTPVIALTADAIQGAKEKYLQEGFSDYVSKPFTKDVIKEKIDKIILPRKEK